MAGGKSFGPQLVSAAAPVGHFSQFQSGKIGLFIHIGKHQNLVCLVILDNDRNHAVTVQLEIRPGQFAF